MTLYKIGTAGNAYGHVPGHQFHDIDVYRRGNSPSIDPPRGRYVLRMTKGSAQERDEIHDRLEVTRQNLPELRYAALNAGLDPGYVETAISRAIAHEALRMAKIAAKG